MLQSGAFLTKIPAVYTVTPGSLETQDTMECQAVMAEMGPKVIKETEVRMKAKRLTPVNQSPLS